MNVSSEDFNLAFDLITPAVKAVLQAQGTHDGFHIMAFALDSGPTIIAERAFGELGKPTRKYRQMAGIKAAETAQKRMSVQDIRIINPEHLDVLRIHDGSTIDKTNGFGVASAGVGVAANIAFVEIVRVLAIQSASQRVPETVAAE